MKHIKYFICILPFFLTCSIKEKKNEFNGETILLKASDGLSVKADLYIINKDAPYIILYHQAGYSRGEYREIAPKLNALGFNCIAIDQRSGKAVNGVLNETFMQAEKQEKSTEYIDALPDLEAAFSYVKNEIKANDIILWGSSYSAALVFSLGHQYQDQVKGILAFSPGEYFSINGHDIKHYAAKVSCPVFITSTKNEQKKWQSIFNAIQTEKTYYLPESAGKHGSQALWNSNKGNAAYWSAVETFLSSLKK